MIRLALFDAYGTVFDVHSAVARHRSRLGEAADSVSQVWRTKQLEYTWLRSLMHRYADFWQVTGEALEYALERHGIRSPELRRELLEAYLRLECYPEVPGVLEQLKGAGITTAILSNGTPGMLEAAVKTSGIAASIDTLLSVDTLGVYKPDPRVYQLALERFKVQPQEVAFQSSNAWDAAGAASFGFRVVWVNRFGQARERLPGEPDAVLGTLEELPGLIREDFPD